MANDRPLTLIILDGFGYREATSSNAIALANMPTWRWLWQNYPHTLIDAHAKAVGLPDDQMGNSEVGHMHMGIGRLLMQDLVRINDAIATGAFEQNPVLLGALKQCQQAAGAVHIMGLLSPGGVHSHENHIFAMLALAAKSNVDRIYLHLILDGRDTPPRSALASIQLLNEKLKSVKNAQIASVIGRYYAMDRDKRYERTEKAYELLTSGQADFYADGAAAALEMAYARGEDDEFVKATCILHQGKAIFIKNQDSLFFMNFRADRARQLSYALTDANFSGFQRKVIPKLSSFVTMTEYAKDLKVAVAFPAVSIKNAFGEYVSKLGLKQLRIAETEKYAHVTFFFNGGAEAPLLGEERILIPSPKVATYDLKPDMSAIELTDRLTAAISSEKFDVIICNYANPDMVGHTGKLDAAIQALECIDSCLRRVIDASKAIGAEVLITSDHGNVEKMFDEETQQAHTAHTTNLVPVVYFGRSAVATTQQGVLYDIAPTLLYLLGLVQPTEMTGHTLFRFEK